MSKKRILLVDDEPMPTRLYLDELREQPKKWDVEWVTGVDDALKAVWKAKRDDQPFDLAILDVMLPPGEELTDEEIEATGDGMTTGLVLRDRIKAAIPSVKILFLTNVRNAKLLSRMWDLEPERVRHKARTLPSELVSQIERLIESKSLPA